jgi:outer membrane protein assembly factor BamB
MRKRYIVVCMFFLLVISSIGSLSFGGNLNTADNKVIVKNFSTIDYNGSVFSTVDQPSVNIYDNEPTLNKNSNSNNAFSNLFVEGPWPMYCHDTRHTSRSPYSTDDNLGVEKWRFDTEEECSGSPIIDKNGIIYIGGSDMFAVYPNGTIKWKFKMDGMSISAPAIDEEGVIYFNALFGEWFVALYADNGSKKWERSIGWTYASPTVGPDGIIYTPATDNWNVIAFYPNGTVKWSFHANERVFSSPAIGDDGTIYCTSYGAYLYALYPENGTVKWQYNTGGSVRTSACIADDGTIYVVSVNGVLHALFPNGTLKWQANIDGGTSPTIGLDGTIYCGYHALYAFNPDGSLKWVFNPGNIGEIKEGTPCNSLDGIIYFGTYASDGGDLIAVNPNGTERWRLHLASGYIMSAPAIGSDGTVYVGSWNDGTLPYSYGYLHAINVLDPDAPSAPVIDGPASGYIKKPYNITFNSTSPFGRDIYYYIEWNDRTATYWAGPYKSGEEAYISHTWLYIGTKTIKARASDSENLWGPWSTFEIKITKPRSIASNCFYWLRFLEQFPNAFPILKYIIRGR